MLPGIRPRKPISGGGSVKVSLTSMTIAPSSAYAAMSQTATIGATFAFSTASASGVASAATASYEIARSRTRSPCLSHRYTPFEIACPPYPMPSAVSAISTTRSWSCPSIAWGISKRSRSPTSWVVNMPVRVSASSVTTSSYGLRPASCEPLPRPRPRPGACWGALATGAAAAAGASVGAADGATSGVGVGGSAEPWAQPQAKKSVATAADVTRTSWRTHRTGDSKAGEPWILRGGWGAVNGSTRAPRSPAPAGETGRAGATGAPPGLWPSRPEP